MRAQNQRPDQRRTPVSRFVLDASVVLSWCLATRSVERLARRRETQAHFRGHDTKLPRRPRGAPGDARTIPSGIVFDRIQFLSRKHGLTAYNAAYLDLALENGLALATLDEPCFAPVRMLARRRCGCELLGGRGSNPNPGTGFVFRLLLYRIQFFFDRREALQNFVHAHRHVPDGLNL